MGITELNSAAFVAALHVSFLTPFWALAGPLAENYIIEIPKCTKFDNRFAQSGVSWWVDFFLSDKSAGGRLKDLREQKKISQGDAEKRTGPLQKLGFVKYNGGPHVDGSLSSGVLHE